MFVDDSPAVVPPPALEEAFETSSGLPEYYFDAGSSRFLLQNRDREWVALSEAAFRRELKSRGLRDKGLPGQLSEIEQTLRETEQNCRVDFAGMLAGWPTGLHKIGAGRCLITRALPVPVPAQGQWPVLGKFFEGLFVGREPAKGADEGEIEIDQRPYFFGWLQHAFDVFSRGKITPGLALCVAGEPNSGKSRLAMVLQAIFGGAVAKPYAAFVGRDNFNRELFEAVLQLIDDENADTSLAARLKLGAELKKIVANDFFKQRGMHRDGVNLSVLWRLVILCNLEANRLMVMPPLDADIRDKVLMLKGYRRPKPIHEITLETPYEDACWPMPMPTRTAREQETFRETMLAELPAFLWWLMFEFKMPSHVAGGRFCVRHWQHPEILNRLGQFSPHVRIWQLIEDSGIVFREYRAGDAETPAEWLPRPEWRGSAVELHRLLTGEQSKLNAHERRAIPDPAWLGQRLEACREHFGEGVCKQTRQGGTGRRIWILRQKEGLIDA